MRGYFFLILSFGIFGAVAGRMTPASAPPAVSSERVIGADSERIAELKAQTQPKFSSEEGAIELQRESDGHFYADVNVNGATVHMLVDTGASGIALSREDALAARIPASIAMTDVIGTGASGAVRGEHVKLERVELGPLSAAGMDAVILDGGGQSLLGQSFLSKFASVAIEGDRMILR